MPRRRCGIGCSIPITDADVASMGVSEAQTHGRCGIRYVRIDIRARDRSRDPARRPVLFAIRRSAARACGIWRIVAGTSGFQARQPATSQRVTARSRTPHRKPYAALTSAGRRPIDGHIVQS